MRDLRRFAVRSPVIPLTVTIALALAISGLVAHSIYSLVFAPVAPTESSSLLVHLFTGSGYLNIGGRLVDWTGPLRAVLQTVLLAGLAVAALRFRRSRRQACAWCGSSIPVSAAVCFRCRKTHD